MLNPKEHEVVGVRGTAAMPVEVPHDVANCFDDVSTETAVSVVDGGYENNISESSGNDAIKNNHENGSHSGSSGDIHNEDGKISGVSNKKDLSNSNSGDCVGATILEVMRPGMRNAEGEILRYVTVTTHLHFILMCFCIFFVLFYFRFNFSFIFILFNSSYYFILFYFAGKHRCAYLVSLLHTILQKLLAHKVCTRKMYLCRLV